MGRGRSHNYVQTALPYEKALAIVEAIGRDPVDFGL